MKKTITIICALALLNGCKNISAANQVQPNLTQPNITTQQNINTPITAQEFRKNLQKELGVRRNISLQNRYAAQSQYKAAKAGVYIGAILWKTKSIVTPAIPGIPLFLNKFINFCRISQGSKPLIIAAAVAAIEVINDKEIEDFAQQTASRAQTTFLNMLPEED